MHRKQLQNHRDRQRGPAASESSSRVEVEVQRAAAGVGRVSLIKALGDYYSVDDCSHFMSGSCGSA